MPVRFAIVGAGDRGTTYAGYILRNPQEAKVVAVAEPRDFYRERLAAEHNIPPENVFSCWTELAEKPRIADAVIIATQDSMHLLPTITFAKKGYNILLEKPMAPKPEACWQIVSEIKKSNVIFALCHVLRYTPYTRELKKIVDSGTIGEIISIQHREPVGYAHQAHSFVRGNWRNERESSFMLLTKSCHDLDWITHIMASRCVKISSFGNLKHFTREHKPAGASDRCVNCSQEPLCPYSAKRLYLERAKRGNFAWPVSIITSDLTVQGVQKALESGPYGRCVYECDNDVVDHQVVNMLFENASTATFTMTAFTKSAARITNIFGTKGEIYCDSNIIKRFDFLTERTEVMVVNGLGGGMTTDHSGGDTEIMKRFLLAITCNDPGKLYSSPEETLESHLMVFAAEMARREERVVQMSEMKRFQQLPRPRPKVISIKAPKTPLKRETTERH